MTDLNHLLHRFFRGIGEEFEMETELKNIDLVGGVMALAFRAWMILTLKSGILKLRTNFMMVAVKMFGFLYLVHD